MRAKFQSIAEGLIDGGAKTAPAHLLSRRLAFGRKLWVAIHCVTGLCLGALFALIGLTGSMLAFWQPVDEWLNADIMRVEAPAQAVYRPLDEIFAAARSAAPPLSMPERLRMPRHSRLAAGFTFLAPTDGSMMEVYEIFVDPYTAKVTGQRLASRADRALSQPFIYIRKDLHWTLLLGYDRAYLVGAGAIFMLASILAGLYLWWPPNGHWRSALTIKWRATPERVAYDVHKTIGLYLAPVLILSLSSGISMIFKPQTRSMAALFSPIRQEPQSLKSAPALARAPLGIDAVSSIAAKVFPDGRLHWILFQAVRKAPMSSARVWTPSPTGPVPIETSRSINTAGGSCMFKTAGPSPQGKPFSNGSILCIAARRSATPAAR